MRKSETYEMIDRYLQNEMSREERAVFEAAMHSDPKLHSEVLFHREVEDSVMESDILSLRDNLERVMMLMEESPVQEVENSEPVYASCNFGLSSEFSSFKMFESPLVPSDVNRLSHSLPRLHLHQHRDSERENIHQFYREQFSEMKDEELFAESDELLFSEVRSAMSEKDILELRASLDQIVQREVTHPYSLTDIEDYLSGEMDDEKFARFEEELDYHSVLRNEVKLHEEIADSVQEHGVMDLRASLSQIRETGDYSMSQSEEIDRYLSNELTEEEQDRFEDLIMSSSVLQSDIALHKELNEALSEQDVIRLRAQLTSIGKDVVKEKGRSIRLPWRKVAVGTVAASLVLMIGLRSLMLESGSSPNEELYAAYYRSYEGSGVARSGNGSIDNTLTIALQKFNARDYESALSLFRQVISYDATNPVGHFYSGVSYQETGRFVKAIEEYELVVKDKDNLFVEQAEWYIGLCYLQTQERRKAYLQMDQISKQNGYYSKKAEAIIRKMKDLE